MKNKILVVGSANADMVIHAPKMPLLGETLVGRNFQLNAGGKGLNQAVAIAKLGGEAAFLGGIGTDANGEMLLGELQKSNVSFEGIRVADRPTGIAMITVVDGNNFILLDEGANAALSPECVWERAETVRNSDFCVMQLEIPLETVAAVCEIAKGSHTKIVLNPAPYKALPPSVLSCVDYLIPNEHEAFALTGIHPDGEAACREVVGKLKEMGVKKVVITLGERGCVYDVGDGAVFRSAQKTTVVDTTSAGDCFIGALVTNHPKGNPWKAPLPLRTKPPP